MGLKASFERDILEKDVCSFGQVSGDLNPLHLDSAYAATTNFGGRIVHGAFQVGLASALVGMSLPGRNVLVGSMHSRFPAPLRYPSRVRVSGELITWNPSTRGGQIRVTIQDLPGLAVTSEIHVSFTFHDNSDRASSLLPAQTSAASSKPIAPHNGKLLLVTGASGGLGAVLASELAADYEILALTHRQRLSSGLSARANVFNLQVDLQSENALSVIQDALGPRRLYGIVHAAWPGAPRGGLLQAEPDTVNLQVSFGTTVVISLARLLFKCVEETGGRFVVIGSTAGSIKPYLPWAAYSLGKACLEHATRLIAPEMARKQITVNVVSPSFVPVGMNKEANERQKLSESASVPLARLCLPDDVVSLVRFLLSDRAGFISGQLMALTGASL